MTCRSCGNPAPHWEYTLRRGGPREPQCLSCHAMLRGADHFRERRITNESVWHPLDQPPVDLRWCIIKRNDREHNAFPEFGVATYDLPPTIWGDEKKWLTVAEQPVSFTHPPEDYSWAYWPGMEPKEQP